MRIALSGIQQQRIGVDRTCSQIQKRGRARAIKQVVRTHEVRTRRGAGGARAGRTVRAFGHVKVRPAGAQNDVVPQAVDQRLPLGHFEAVAEARSGVVGEDRVVVEIHGSRAHAVRGVVVGAVGAVDRPVGQPVLPDVVYDVVVDGDRPFGGIHGIHQNPFLGDVVHGVVVNRKAVHRIAVAARQRRRVNLDAGPAPDVFDQVPGHLEVVAVGARIETLLEAAGRGQVQIVTIIAEDLGIGGLQQLERRSAAAAGLGIRHIVADDAPVDARPADQDRLHASQKQAGNHPVSAAGAVAGRGVRGPNAVHRRRRRGVADRHRGAGIGDQSLRVAGSALAPARAKKDSRAPALSVVSGLGDAVHGIDDGAGAGGLDGVRQRPPGSGIRSRIGIAAIARYEIYAARPDGERQAVGSAVGVIDDDTAGLSERAQLDGHFLIPEVGGWGRHDDGRSSAHCDGGIEAEVVAIERDERTVVTLAARVGSAHKVGEKQNRRGCLRKGDPWQESEQPHFRKCGAHRSTGNRWRISSPLRPWHGPEPRQAVRSLGHTQPPVQH